jgi:hypothetical protein
VRQLGDRRQDFWRKAIERAYSSLMQASIFEKRAQIIIRPRNILKENSY